MDTFKSVNFNFNFVINNRKSSLIGYVFISYDRPDYLIKEPPAPTKRQSV
jgi:hypothetical protein